jgi:hypothetical protein
VKLELVGAFNTGTDVRAVSVSDDYAYVGESGEIHGRLHVLDVRAPTLPQEIGCSDPISDASAVAVSGGYVYVAGDAGGCGQHGLVILDITDPTHPRKVGESGTGGAAFSVTVSGDYAYLTSDCFDCGKSRGGLEVFNVVDPANPEGVGGYGELCPPSSGTVSGKYFYMTGQHWDNGCRDVLTVIDVSKPAEPQCVGWYDTELPAQWVAVSDNYAYVAVGSVDLHGWLAVFDISEPLNARLVTRVGIGGVPIKVVVRDSFAYVLDTHRSLVVLDIKDPTKPFKAGECAVAGSVHGLALSADYAYVAAGEAGLQIFRLVELPAITRHTIANGELHLQWNEPAKGMRLQRATSLTQPHWQDLMGSELTNNVSMPMWSGPEFFRLVRP